MNTAPRWELDLRPEPDVAPDEADLDTLAPTTLIQRQGVWRIFGFSETTWRTWETEGRAPEGLWGKSTRGRPPKLYTVAELREFRDRLRREREPYSDPDRPGVYRVPIRSSRHRLEALIEAADLPLVEGKHWNWSPITDGPGDGCVLLATTGRQTPLKQIILGLGGRNQRIIHANGDPLDCRRDNLIVKTIAQTCRGSRKMVARKRRACSSRYKGVCWCAERRLWLAQIVRSKKHHHLGRFEKEIDAARAYDRAARTLFGVDARLNFPENPAEAASAHLAPATPARTLAKAA